MEVGAAMKNRRRGFLIAGLVAVVVALLVVATGFLLKDQSAELNRSIELVLNEKLKLPTAHIVQEALIGRRETDANGYWSVAATVPAGDLAIALSNAAFGESNSDDAKYFRSEVQRELKTGDLSEFRAFEASMNLGEGTICETNACNVVVLLGEGKENFFVVIWKI
jgi:hypothetical protein